jgi:LacI family transcriptional regulator
MMEIADKKSYHIILTVSREERQKESENILKLLSMNVDGLLVCQTLDTVEAEIFEKVKKRNKPIVFFGRPVGFSGYDYVGFDDFEAAKKLTEYLLKKGKTKIAHISGDLKSDGRYRLDGFLSAMKENKINVQDEWIVEGKFFPEYGYEGFNRIYESGKLPEVIFCGNGMIAKGAYEAIREKGLRLPEDIGVVAIDHKTYSEMLYPKLTYIDYPTRTLGNEAMSLLFKKIEKKSSTDKQEQKILETYLVENNSLI